MLFLDTTFLKIKAMFINQLNANEQGHDLMRCLKTLRANFFLGGGRCLCPMYLIHTFTNSAFIVFSALGYPICNWIF